MNKLAMIMRESKAARFLIPAGLMLIVIGIVFFVISKNQQNYIEAESIVTKVELESEEYTNADGEHVDAAYAVTVKYTADGKEYESVLSGLGKLTEGDKMKIYYNPADPGQITNSKSLVVPIIMIAAGIAAFAGGILSAVNAVKKYRKMKEQEKEWTND